MTALHVSLLTSSTLHRPLASDRALTFYRGYFIASTRWNFDTLLLFFPLLLHPSYFLPQRTPLETLVARDVGQSIYRCPVGSQGTGHARRGNEPLTFYNSIMPWQSTQPPFHAVGWILFVSCLLNGQKVVKIYPWTFSSCIFLINDSIYFVCSSLEDIIIIIIIIIIINIIIIIVIRV